MYQANHNRYAEMAYRRCGRSGLLLPEISLGLWQHFDDTNALAHCRQIILKAFDHGITHFGLANNYGGGSAEENFGRILQSDLRPYRDELIITTKAGHDMWPGPYGEWGSRKYLLASLDQSLKRLGVDYVDIFYSHRPDPDTPLEETMSALAQAVRQGKALYVGLSNYSPEMTHQAARLLKEMGTPCLIHQPKYSMFDREPETSLFDVLQDQGMGSIVFQPLAQGLLTNKYLNGIPADSRIAKGVGALKAEQIDESLVCCLNRLNEVACRRNQSLAQMALAWLLKDNRVTSVLIGASRPEQLEDNLRMLQHKTFEDEELTEIENILQNYHSRK